MKTKELKKFEAAERNAYYSKLSIEQKLEILDKGGFKATKQRLRLLKEASNDNRKR